MPKGNPQLGLTRTRGRVSNINLYLFTRVSPTNPGRPTTKRVWLQGVTKGQAGVYLLLSQPQLTRCRGGKVRVPTSAARQEDDELALLQALQTLRSQP